MIAIFLFIISAIIFLIASTSAVFGALTLPEGNNGPIQVAVMFIVGGMGMVISTFMALAR